VHLIGFVIWITALLLLRLSQYWRVPGESPLLSIFYAEYGYKYLSPLYAMHHSIAWHDTHRYTIMEWIFLYSIKNLQGRLLLSRSLHAEFQSILLLKCLAFSTSKKNIIHNLQARLLLNSMLNFILLLSEIIIDIKLILLGPHDIIL